MNKIFEIDGVKHKWSNDDWEHIPAKFRIYKTDDIPILEKHIFSIELKYQHKTRYTQAHTANSYTRELFTERYQDTFGYVSSIEKASENTIMSVIIQPQRNDIYELHLVPLQQFMYTIDLKKSAFLKMEKWIKEFKKE